MGGDFVGRLFAGLEEDGECIDIRYGQVLEGGVRWHVRSHARFDGIGGFADTVRSRSVLPQLRGTGPRQPLESARRLTALWQRPTAGWRALPSRRAPQLVVRGHRPASAWAVLDVRAPSTGTLLSCLNAAVAKELTFADGPALWIVPVNMRGAITQRRALANHLSCVPVALRRNSGPGTATRQIRGHLRDGTHWLLYSAMAAGAFVPISRLADGLRGRSVGMLSNLGSWQTPGRWVFCPPPTRFLPLSAGVITAGGTLGIMLQAYPSLTMSDATVSAWLDAWSAALVSRSAAAAT